MKKPSLTFPKPIAELVADLRERRLLPVAIALVAAIVAVPVLLSSGSDKPAPTASTTAADAAAAAPEAQSLVVAKGESLRDYRKRLAHEAAKDPFVQQYAAPDVSAGDSTGTSLETIPVGGDSGATTTGSGSSKSGSKGGGSKKPSDGSSASAKPETQYVSYEIDAWTGQSGDLKLREGVQRFTPLPFNAKPTAVFLGVTNDAKKALFQVSSSVLTLSGDGVCLLGIGRCDMIALAPGKTATFLFGPDGITYAVKVVRINKVVRSQ